MVTERMPGESEQEARERIAAQRGLYFDQETRELHNHLTAEDRQEEIIKHLNINNL